MKVTKVQAREMAKRFNIDLDVVDIDEFRYGIQVELEHGSIVPLTNVTDDDLVATTKIALAHLLEYPDYYKRLKEMEERADKYWSKRKKPCVIKNCAFAE